MKTKLISLLALAFAVTLAALAQDGTFSYSLNMIQSAPASGVVEHFYAANALTVDKTTVPLTNQPLITAPPWKITDTTTASILLADGKTWAVTTRANVAQATVSISNAIWATTSYASPQK